MRKKLVAGNWKMYTNVLAAIELTTGIRKGLGNESRVDVAICPPFPYLALVGPLLKDGPIALGAQNCYPENEGAFTGEVSPLMLADAGCRYVIVGHSERRRRPEFAESDAFINRKVKAALAAGLSVILCVGETIEEREADRTEAVLDTQLVGSLKDVMATALARLVLAYEPVWAIGTGRNATPEQAQQAHAFLRRRVGELYSKEAAQALVIQYGGSVKPDNAASLLHQPDVDGALVGGASLQAESFVAIVRAALS
jgi:triosephosphate isomerase